MAAILFLVIILVIGILYCFYGNRFLKLVMFVYAFMLAYHFVLRLIAGSFPSLADSAILIAVICGVICGFLTFFFVKLALFLAGGMMGLMIFDFIKLYNSAYFTAEPVVAFLVGLICFIVCGMIMVLGKKLLFVLFSSIFGAYTITTAVGMVIGLMQDSALMRQISFTNTFDTLNASNFFLTIPMIVPVAITAVLAICGMVRQFRHR